MRASYSEIKNNAKSAMKGHIGEAILVALILPIAFSMIGSFFNSILGAVHWSIPAFLATFTNAIATYITLRMIIKIVRHKSDKIFIGFLGTKKGILSSMGFALVTMSFGLVYIFVFWEYFTVLWDVMKLLQTDFFTSNPDAIEDWLNSIIVKEPSALSLIFTALYTIIILIVTVRISFTTYIIADSDLNVFEALKKSWNITRGNWWRIFFFPLSFILWIFAIIFTFGLAIIYVGPYIAIAHGALYNALLLESGEEIDLGHVETIIQEVLTDENALDEKEDTFDKKDPFENYYE